MPGERGGEEVSPVPPQGKNVKKHRERSPGLHSPMAREAGTAGQPDVGCEIASSWTARGYPPLAQPFRRPDEAVGAAVSWALVEEDSRQGQAAMRFPAEDNKPLADFMVRCRPCDAAGSPRSTGSGSWEGEKIETLLP